MDEKGIDVDFSGRTPGIKSYVGANGDEGETLLLPKGKQATQSYFMQLFMSCFYILAASFVAVLGKGLGQIIYEEQANIDPSGVAFFSGIAVALALGLAQHAGASFKPWLLLWEWLTPRFRSQYGGWGWGMVAVLFFWLAILAGAFLAAWFLWMLQLNNTITHAGVPVLGMNNGRGFAVEFVGAVFWGWAYFVIYHHTEMKKHVHRLLSAIVLGFLEAMLVYFAFPYSRGSFNVAYWLSTASMSGYFPEGYWIYIIAPMLGYLLGFILHYLSTMNWSNLMLRAQEKEE